MDKIEKSKVGKVSEVDSNIIEANFNYNLIELFHSIKNCICVVSGNISLLSLKETIDNDYFHILNNLTFTVDNINGIVMEYLSDVKDSLKNKKLCNLDIIIADIIQQLNYNKDLIKILFYKNNDKILPVEVDENKIYQVILNLILNSIQSFRNNSGVIKITLENTVLNRSVNNLRSGNYVKIEVEDNGMGIKEEDKQKLFSPSFTTKRNGNGFGLFSSYLTIRNHNGFITVDSRYGEGTIFSIFLPAYSPVFNIDE
ncbi:MAG TPA: HAMP domain-containing sensor histidine kinase [Spirochaetota bacterium]|nr:HAMP domain-containing sensor histidine kinase [Spirochaetota bacterium]